MTKLRTVRNAGADRLAAERVLGLAATGLQALAASLDSRFDRALDLLAAGRAGLGELAPVEPLEAAPALFDRLAGGPAAGVKLFVAPRD